MLEEKNTLCNKLWKEIYIDYTGSVYSCCHEQPSIIGNIYNQDIEEIINNSIIRKYRTMSLEGNLPCFEACNIMTSHSTIRENKADTIDIKNMHTLKILFGERCNLNCVMCWQDSKKMELLDFDKVKQHIRIKNFKHVIIQGGEPFYCRQALDFFDYAVSRGVKVSFLTNGVLITEEWARKIAQYSSFIHISLNAATKEMHELINKGSDWDRVLKNIKTIRKYKEKFNTDIQIKGHMTIIEENIHEIGLFIRRFQEIGLDIARFGYDKEIPSFLSKHVELKEKLRLEIKESITELNKEKIDYSRLKLLGLID